MIVKVLEWPQHIHVSTSMLLWWGIHPYHTGRIVSNSTCSSDLRKIILMLKCQEVRGSRESHWRRTGPSSGWWRQLAGVQMPAAQCRLPWNLSLVLSHAAMESDPKPSFPTCTCACGPDGLHDSLDFYCYCLWLLNSSSNLLLCCPDRNCPLLWFRIYIPGILGVTVAEEGHEKVVWAEETPWPCAGFLAASDSSTG